MNYAKEKAMLLLMAALFLAIFATAGYYAGICHAIRDTKVSYHAGVVTFELDGNSYEHIANGWVSSR